jgi:methanogenic corrinoid protein MtbC1
MAQLYPYIFTTEKTGQTMVATCIGGELHELGIRMVADFLEMEGWDTYYLGANTPARAIVQTVQQRRADVLAISGTMPFHVSQIAALVAQIRAEEAGARVKFWWAATPSIWTGICGAK